MFSELPTDHLGTPTNLSAPDHPAVVQPVISLRHVNHWFGIGEARKQALKDITIDILPGQIVICTGPSGSGKTTLLTLLGGLRSWRIFVPLAANQVCELTDTPAAAIASRATIETMMWLLRLVTTHGAPTIGHLDVPHVEQ